MKLKIQILEGFYTSIWKKPIEIETDDYPQLEGMTQDQIMDYINSKSYHLPGSPGGDAQDWSLYDELMDQEKELEKEKNYESSIELWSK